MNWPCIVKFKKNIVGKNQQRAVKIPPYFDQGNINLMLDFSSLENVAIKVADTSKKIEIKRAVKQKRKRPDKANVER